jgi:AmpD protein
MTQGYDWLEDAQRAPSDNCDERPPHTAICLVVLHNISLPPGRFGGDDVEHFFTNALDCEADPFYAQLRDVRVSAHLFLRRDGRWLQFVPFGRRAWHAGLSNWRGRPRCNDFSIGIELEGTDVVPYTEAQYAALAPVLGRLVERFPIEAIVGHSDISPGRKTDPGEAFDWSRTGCSLPRL